MSELTKLLDSNTKWADSIKEDNPEFFSQLAEKQEPDILWIGCSDSRVPPNQLLDLPPGEIFVHRNIANVVVHSDVNCLSVVQYAVEMLEVSHVIVCGHYGCGGVKAAVEDEQLGLIDHWLEHLKDIKQQNIDELKALPHDQMINRFCELNVATQVDHICRTSFVQNAWENGADLTVHGLIYSLETGKINELGINISTQDEASKLTT
ncbi:MAG TPA: carbonic anhydrase [Balneolaceae bacterium]|nr:carbonic anhydrase [Balneolaceae bacterium]